MSYTLGPAGTFAPILEAAQTGDHAALAADPTSVLTPLWQEDATARGRRWPRWLSS